jgi:hypothetical protein
MTTFFRRSLLLALAVLLLTSGTVYSQTSGAQTAGAQPPATIYLIRHAEKLLDKRPDLSEQGFRRAAVLPNLFIPIPGSGRGVLTKPDFIFATARSKNSNRPYETVQPLAAALKEPISNEILDDDYADLAKLLLSGKYAGKVVLVAWHHGKLPQLTTALGATPPYKWPDEQFDRIWRIDYKDGKATLTDLPMGLFPEDSK